MFNCRLLRQIMSPNDSYLYKQMKNQRLGNNIVTIRSGDWMYNLPRPVDSESYTEAKMREHWFFNKTPFMLKCTDLSSEITPENAKRNFKKTQKLQMIMFINTIY